MPLFPTFGDWVRGVRDLPRAYAKALLSGVGFMFLWGCLGIFALYLNSREADPGSVWALRLTAGILFGGYYPALFALGCWHSRPSRSGRLGKELVSGFCTGMVPGLPVIAVGMLVTAWAGMPSSGRDPIAEAGAFQELGRALFIYPVPLAAGLGGLLSGLYSYFAFPPPDDAATESEPVSPPDTQA